MFSIILLSFTILLFYIKVTKNFSYWKKKGVAYVSPYPIIGSILDVYLMKKSPSQLAEQIYNEYSNEKVVGIFRSSQPVLLVRDLSILKRIFANDFPSFYSRGFKVHNEEPMLRNVFFADGDLWRLLRQSIAHAFSSGKLRAMYPLIEEVSTRLQKKVVEISTNEKVIDVHELMGRYTTDIIGSCGFGLNVDSLNNADCAFRLLGKGIFKFGIREGIIMILKDNFPRFFKHLKYFPKIERDMTNLITHIQEERNYEPSGRNDFIDIMMECKKRGTIICESMEGTESETPVTTAIEITDELIAAQAYIFFAAGFETSSFVSSYTLHQLAYHTEHQTKVQKQIDEVLAKHNNQICFEAVKEMTYLECAFKESIRMFPPVGFLTRECTKTFTIPEINVTIDKGVLIVIPIRALHMDPKYFHKPNEFLPDRFLSNNVGKIDKYTYFPFGAGPRTCIGERLGQIQTMAGLAAVLSRCSVEPAPNSRKEPIISPIPNIIQSVIGGLPLTLKRRTV